MHYQDEKVVRFKNTQIYIIKEAKGKVLVIPDKMILVEKVYILSLNSNQNQIVIISNDYNCMCRTAITYDEIVDLYDWLYENLLSANGT